MRICCVAGLLRLDFSGDYVSGRRRGREEEEDTFRMVGDCAIGRQHSACTRKKPRPMKSCERKLDTRYQSRDFLHSYFVSWRVPTFFFFFQLWERFTLAAEQSASKPSTFIHFPKVSGQNNVHAFTVCSYKRNNWPFLFKTGMCHIFPSV